MDLPPELIHEVLLYLIEEDTEKLRSVFPKVIEDPYFLNKHLPITRYLKYSLYQCCEEGFTEAVKLYMRDPSTPSQINSKTKYGKTSLDAAVINGRTEIVSLLLTCPQLKVNTGVWDITPLGLAVFERYVDIVRLLVNDPRTEVNQTMDIYHENTALHYAASQGYPEIAEILLSHPDINPQVMNLDDETPFDVALETQGPNAPVTKLLVAAMMAVI